jgi:transcriptional regulator with XRE-family HTH domain
MGVSRQSPPSPELKIFSDRLQKVIEFKKTDTAILAKSLDYKPDDIYKLLTGMREPSMKKLILLADLLGCSVDYLLGLTPEPQRASVVVEADTDALTSQSNEREQTSGQITGKEKPFLSMVSELPESDIELLMYIAGFLIERKEKRLSKIVSAIKNVKEENDSTSRILSSKEDSGLELTDDDLDEDSLWDDVEEDEFEDSDFEDSLEDENDDDDDDDEFDD